MDSNRRISFFFFFFENSHRETILKYLEKSNIKHNYCYCCCYCCCHCHQNLSFLFFFVVFTLQFHQYHQISHFQNRWQMNLEKKNYTHFSFSFCFALNSLLMIWLSTEITLSQFVSVKLISNTHTHSSLKTKRQLFLFDERLKLICKTYLKCGKNAAIQIARAWNCWQCFS